MWLMFLLMTPPLEIIASPPPVTVQAYTESLCIDCKNFIDRQLVSAYHKLGTDVIDLQIVPFGNARLDTDQQTVKCQHGEAECDANTWEQCAVEQYPPPTYLEFIGCLETSIPMGYSDEIFDESIFQDCAELAFIDFPQLKECHDNPLERWILQQEYANLTPDHEYVPWIIINGNFFDEEKQDFFKEVCEEYAASGGSHPACSEAVTESN
jgi:interferon gamma-inducible protein 30